jgi:protein SCO1
MRILRGLSFGLILLSVCSLTLAEAGAAGRSDIPQLKGPPKGGDFTLESLSGPVSTASYRGKVVILYFGYTQCPDVCPTSLSLITQALNELDKEELEKIVGIFVSVDPKRDTLERLAEYVGYFHPNFIGVTGTPESVAVAADLYGAQYGFTDDSNSAMGYIVNHSAAVYLLDQAGELRFVFPHETPPETMLGAMRMLFEER